MSSRASSAQADELLQSALRTAGVGDRARALRQLEHAIGLQPRHPGIRNALGVLRLESGDISGALAVLKPLAKELPQASGIQLNFGNALVAARRYSEAIVPLKRATALDAASAVAWYGYARALHYAGRVAEAEQAYRTVIARDPNHALAAGNLAATCNFQDRYADGEAVAREALMRNPRDAGAHFNRAMSLLAQGAWAEGWAEYEWREATDLLSRQRRTSTAPRWNGEPLVGTTLLVLAEQGFGDTLHFARYLPLLREPGARVVLQCPAALVSLLRASMLADDVISFDDEPPPHAWHVPLTGVPHRLRLHDDRAVYLSDAAYLSMPAATSNIALPTRDGMPRVGLVWAGSATHVNDMHRSCGLDALMPLLRSNIAQWISLQTGERATDLTRVPRAITVYDAAPTLSTFADTASLLTQLDLVITVDSAVAHLAGALGVACWLLLPRIGLDWRWAVHHTDAPLSPTPWYASVRCLRQSRVGEWRAESALLVNALATQFATAASTSVAA